jgi:cardiolipin synthase
MAYLLAHAATVIAALASFVMVVSLLRSRRTPQSTLAWLLALGLLPWLALPLFFLLGARKFPPRAKRPGAAAGLDVADEAALELAPLARVLRATGVAPVRTGNRLELLPTGEAAYARLLELIAGAERSIDLTMFILGSDATGRSIVAALAARARRGVRVRVILDAVGSLHSRDHAARELGEAGGELRIFMPFWHSPLRGRTNLRSHRKLAIFDDALALAGGMNLADEYMGAPGPRAEPRWRDVAAVCRGPVAADATALFESDWRYCGGAPAPALATRGPDVDEAAGDALLQLVPSGPDFSSDTVYDLFLAAIYSARRRVALITPYYVPDDALQRALVSSARRGVATVVLVPSVSNHALADLARRPLLRELEAAGVTLKYYDKGMVHAKAMVVDDAFAYVGSPNFDMRSLFLNYEVALCAYSPAAVGQVSAYVDALLSECVDRGPAVGKHPIIEQLAQFLAPEL